MLLLLLLLLFFIYYFASSNILFIFYALPPLYDDINDDELIYLNLQLLSFASAFANNVLPTPALPTNNIPFGIYAPIYIYYYGFFIYSTISYISSIYSSIPFLNY